MIWFLIGVAPFVLLLAVGLIKVPGATVFGVGLMVAVMGFVVIAMYGAWQMDWVNHCGNFWESYSCTGKVVTNR